MSVELVRDGDGDIMAVHTSRAPERLVAAPPAAGGARRAEDLTAAERAQGEAALAAAGGAPTLDHLTRLRLMPDRTWGLACREPKHSREGLGGAADRPWEHRAALLSVERIGPIAEVLELLATPGNGDAEMARRDHLVATRVRQIEEGRAQALEDERTRNAEAQKLRDEQQRIDREFRREAWERLPHDARALYLVALAVEDGGDVAKAIRSVASGLASGYGGGPVFPGRRWW